MSAVKEMALSSAQEQAMASAVVPSVSMFERLASDPNVDVAKLEKLIEMQERVLAHQAEAAFDEAFAVMQAELKVVVARAKGDNGKWHYAPREDITEMARPILSKHGFSMSHETEWPDKGTVLIIGVLAHRQGHKRRSRFQSAADTSGSKNAVQALGSTIEYGRRYTTCDLLNIVTRGADDDARRATENKKAEAPDGYDEWLSTLALKANDGLPALQEMWATANRDSDLRKYAEYLTKTEPDVWNELKKRAAKVVAK